MTRLEWSSAAETDIDHITDYIAQRNPLAAIETREEIEARIKFRKTFPAGWKAGRVLGTREMVLAGLPYIAVYEVRAEEITILRILHSSQKWPPE